MPNGAAHHGLDPIGRSDRILVLPDYDQLPAGRGERGRVAPITFDVPFELGVPVLGVRRWRNSVYWAAMPEAAKALHDDPLTRKHYVGTKSQARDEGDVLSEPQSTAVQLAPQGDFRRCVRRPVAPHDGAHRG